jgi:hypothetical protein
VPGGNAEVGALRAIEANVADVLADLVPDQREFSPCASSVT